MAMHWGNVWYAVKHPNPALTGIMMFSKFPAASGLIVAGKEVTEVLLPNLPDLELVPAIDRKNAELLAKDHILRVTKEPICVSSYSLTDSELDIESYRLKLKARPITESERTLCQRRIIALESDVKKYKDDIKSLKAKRRAAIHEFIGDELESLYAKLNQSN